MVLVYLKTAGHDFLLQKLGHWYCEWYTVNSLMFAFLRQKACPRGLILQLAQVLLVIWLHELCLWGI